LDDIETKFLTEVANNLAFGIDILRERAEQDILSQELKYLSTHDRLTGLANRALLVDRVQQAMAYARRYQRLVAVINLDVNTFKHVNDTLGTDAGDEYIKEISRRLRAAVRENDTVARVGSDEFVLILSDQKDVAATSDLLTRILAVVRDPVMLCGMEIATTCSVGCSYYPGDGTDSDVLLRRANIARHRAEDAGVDSISYFTTGLDTTAADLMKLEADLRNAISHKELLLYYQPQVDLQTGKVVGVETLLRWQHPERGMVPPSCFIPIAEKSGLILKIGEWVLQAACLQMKAWRVEGLELESIAVNLSACQLSQTDISQILQRILQDTGLDPNFLELELTESMLMEDFESSLNTLFALKNLGVRLSIDDFGTGYSSLGYLRRFPINRRAHGERSEVRGAPTSRRAGRFVVV
jgi:diguanylate cyclase (GGDEF)-like protein